MPLDLTDDKSTLVQVMAWCRQATSHYLSQCWPRSMSPNGVTRPQWVKHQWNKQKHSPSNRPIMNVFMGTGSYIQTYTWKKLWRNVIRAWKGCENTCNCYQNMILIMGAKALFQYKDHLSRYGIKIKIKIKWSWDHLIFIIIKSEVWTITHCLGLGHETMASAVCLSIFLWGLIYW